MTACTWSDKPTGQPDVRWEGTGGGSNSPDPMRLLLDYVSFSSKGLLFCPDATHPGGNIGQKPGYYNNSETINSLTDEDRSVWTQYFFLETSGGVKFYSIGYSLFSGMKIDPAWMPSDSRWIWIWSGNSSRSREPRVQGSAKDCVAADYQYCTSSSLERPYVSNHSQGYTATDPCGLDFDSSNAAYGDGHVERHKALDYCVERDYSPWNGWFAY